jgi:hypothetical protein
MEKTKRGQIKRWGTHTSSEEQSRAKCGTIEKLIGIRNRREVHTRAHMFCWSTITSIIFFTFNNLTVQCTKLQNTTHHCNHYTWLYCSAVQYSTSQWIVFRPFPLTHRFLDLNAIELILEQIKMFWRFSWCRNFKIALAILFLWRETKWEGYQG